MYSFVIEMFETDVNAPIAVNVSTLDLMYDCVPDVPRRVARRVVPIAL